VLQGLGGGQFANARVARSGSKPSVALGIDSARVVRLADLTGSGLADLILLGANGVTVYRGDGRGGFRPRPTIPVGANPTGLTVTDVDADGMRDLLVGNTYGDVLILHGNGDGTFAPFLKTDRAIALAVADLDGDGRNEFIFANQGLDRVTVTYSFGPQPVVIGDQARGLLAPGAVTLADLNGDGLPDLIVANSGSNNVLVYPGLATASSARPPTAATASSPAPTRWPSPSPTSTATASPTWSWPTTAPTTSRSSTAAARARPGRSTRDPRLKAGAGPAATVVMDVDKDGKPDILVSESLANQVRLLPGVGQGFFDDQNPTFFPVGTDPGPIFVGNFTGVPNQLDLVTINAGSNDLTLIRNFQAGNIPQSIPSRGIDPVAALAGDFNVDGRTDLLVANSGDGTLALFLSGLDELAFFGEMNSPETPTRPPWPSTRSAVMSSSFTSAPRAVRLPYAWHSTWSARSARSARSAVVAGVGAGMAGMAGGGGRRGWGRWAARRGRVDRGHAPLDGRGPASRPAPADRRGLLPRDGRHSADRDRRGARGRAVPDRADGGRSSVLAGRHGRPAQSANPRRR